VKRGEVGTREAEFSNIVFAILLADCPMYTLLRLDDMVHHGSGPEAWMTWCIMALDLKQLWPCTGNDIEVQLHG